MSQFPIIKIEIERMRQSLVVAIERHLEAQKLDLQAAVDNAIKEFNFAGAIKHETDIMLRQLVNNAVNRIRWDEELMAKIGGLVEKTLKEKATP